MKKLISIILITTFLILYLPFNTLGDIEKLNKNTIMIDNSIWNQDFKQFLEATKDSKVKHWNIVIHSQGGDAYSTIAIINKIKKMKKRGVTFTTEVYGLAASAAAYLFLMGDKRIAHSGSSFMWHTVEAQVRARGLWVYAPERIKAMIRLCDNFIRKHFKEKTGMSDKSVAYWLDGGAAQWMSAKTAYNVGIATELVE